MTNYDELRLTIQNPLKSDALITSVGSKIQAREQRLVKASDFISSMLTRGQDEMGLYWDDQEPQTANEANST